MGLLGNPEATLKVAGVEFFEAPRERRGTWVSIAIVALLHVAGLYAIATWTPRSEWMKLWKPMEVKLIQEKAPKPPEIKPEDEPPPPPPPKVVERKPEPPPPFLSPRWRKSLWSPSRPRPS